MVYELIVGDDNQSYGFKTSISACSIGYYSNISDFDCVPCPPLSTTKQIGSVSIDDCVCIKGYHGNLALGENCTGQQHLCFLIIYTFFAKANVNE